MVYKCQTDSFLKEFSTTVVSCTPTVFETSIEGEDIDVEGYEVILEDTILFPEGGGQPCDVGFLDDEQVIKVIRRGADAIHYTTSSFEVGQSVVQTLDWERRHDHMQQHSGQHLITAVINETYGYETTAWWLGEDICYIELDTTKLEAKDVDYIEKTTNEKIREAITFTVDVYPKDDPILSKVRGRGLPEDHVGGVRVVTIEGIESDMCCGTHVTNSSQLQVTKLLGVEKGKKNKINLQFIFGDRVIKKIATMMKREQELTGLLNNGPECHVDLISKSIKSIKLVNKNFQNLLKELAILEAKSLKDLDPKPKYYSSHRKEAEADYFNIFLKEFNDKSVLLFLTVGDEKGAGHMMLHGDATIVQELGDKISALLEGKGAGKDSKYQAKVKNMKNRKQAVKLIAETLDKISEQ